VAAADLCFGILDLPADWAWLPTKTKCRLRLRPTAPRDDNGQGAKGITA
jgi:hypothetical protein